MPALTNRNRVTETVDTEQYLIENIHGNQIDRNTILYAVKWEGYSSEWDTAEAEWRMTCDEKLIEFAMSVIDPQTYIEKIPGILESLESYEYDTGVILKVLDPLSIIAQTTVQCGSVKFVDIDTIGSKFMFLEYIRDSKQNYLFHSAFVPSDDVVDESMDRYRKELKFRLQVFKEHPFIKIEVPPEIETIFYSPPPLSNLLFEPVTAEMYQMGGILEHVFVPGSKDIGFNKSRVFLRPSYLTVPSLDKDPRYFKHFIQNKGKKLYEGMERLPYHMEPRFRAGLELSQEIGRGWILRVAHDVEEDTPLMMMTGIITPWETAHKSLIRVGERVAFSSFVEIPGTDMCLDRRQLHDFSRYIPHSCNPTCSVRLVRSGNQYPDLVIYSLYPLNEASGHTISIDWYGSFTRDVKKYFWRNRHPDGKIFSLYERKIDFIHCQCLSPKCREVLYVDKSLKAEDQSARKKEKLNNLDPKFEFHGMSVVESHRIWEVYSGHFVE